jgi:hypothetical protein
MNKPSIKTNSFFIRPGLVKLNISVLSLALKQFLWVWLTLILSLYLSWIVLANANFLYGFWYDYAGIDENIEQYAPQNRFRDYFETTDAQTRKALFSGMVTAIHQHGQGLQDLSYPHPTKPLNIPLLHSAEVTHLTDVAHLIDFLKKIGWSLLFIWGALTTYLLMSRQPVASPKSLLLNIGIGLLTFSSPIFIFGAKQVFYQLHIWVFPADHQWFFYYQDSLMSTMMKAPDLFAYIGMSLLTLGLLLFLLLFKLFHFKTGQSHSSQFKH